LPTSNTEARRTLSSQAAIIDAEIKALELSLKASLEPFVRPCLEFDMLERELMTEKDMILHLNKLTGDLKQAQLSGNWQSYAKVDQAISSARAELASTRRKLSKRVLNFRPIVDASVAEAARVFALLRTSEKRASADASATEADRVAALLRASVERVSADASATEADRVAALLRASVERVLADAGAAEADRVAALLCEFDEPAMGGAKPTNSKKSPDKLYIHDLKKIITEEGEDFTDIAIGPVLEAGLADRLSSMRAEKASSSSISALAANRG
jgi:hypothetical protein